LCFPRRKSAVNLLATLPLLLQWGQHNAGSVTGTFIREGPITLGKGTDDMPKTSQNGSGEAQALPEGDSPKKPRKPAKTPSESKIEYIPVEKLIPFARNSRTHDDAQVVQIAGSIKEFGFTNPVLVDSDNGIIAGHGRVLAARKLGLNNVPCIRLEHLTESQKKAYIIADNKLALNAGWNDDLLRLELKDLQEMEFDLNLTGFSPEEIKNLLTPEQVEGLTDENAVPETPADPITKHGDIWILGNHRIMCGDSTSVDDVDRLMDDHKADICFTSPPYALGKSVALSGNKSMKSKQNAYETHKDDADSWADLMSGWWNASLGIVTKGWVVNVQPLAGNKRNLMSWINDRINRLADIVTWDKGHAAPPMAAGVMASRYEWMVIFGDDNASRAIPCSSWRGTIQSVYTAPPQRDNEFSSIHAATMPVHVPLWVMEKLCDTAKSVYEPFCGTGTTLIAAEKLNKQCFGMEIDPKYCDVIVQRWQEFTGKTAILESTGEPFIPVKQAA
jgi:DNA modification methylase